MTSERQQELIERLNKLSPTARWIVGLDYFGKILMNKPLLAQAQSPAQEQAYEELLDVGFVHVDVERGEVGYRSTYDGRDAAAIYRSLTGAVE